MGCCFSNPDANGSKKGEKDKELSRFSLTHAEVYPFKPLSGIKFLPCSASWVTQPLSRVHSKVVVSEGHIFLALFETFGAHEAADFCQSNCYNVFVQCQAQAKDPSSALRNMFLELHNMLLVSQPSSTKAENATINAVAVYINLQSLCLYAAAVGKCFCFISSAQGSFTQSTAEACVVVKGLPSRFGMQPPPEPEAASNVDPSQAGSAPGTDPSAELHRVQVERPSTGGTSADILSSEPPFTASACQVGRHELCTPDEAIVLASDGLLSLVSVEQAALLLHHFSMSHILGLKTALLSDLSGALQGAASGLGSDTHSLEAENYNSAATLVRHTMNKRHHPDVELAAQGPGAPLLPITSAGAIVVGLDWPKSLTTDQVNMTKMLHAKRVSNPRATYHWFLVRQMVRFIRQHRHLQFRHWFDLNAKVVKQAKVHARKKEVVAWKAMGKAVQVSVTGGVREVRPISSFNSRAATKAMSVNDTVQAANRTPKRAPASSASQSRAAMGTPSQQSQTSVDGPSSPAGSEVTSATRLTAQNLADAARAVPKSSRNVAAPTAAAANETCDAVGMTGTMTTPESAKVTRSPRGAGPVVPKGQVVSPRGTAVAKGGAQTGSAKTAQKGGPQTGSAKTAQKALARNVSKQSSEVRPSRRVSKSRAAAIANRPEWRDVVDDNVRDVADDDVRDVADNGVSESVDQWGSDSETGLAIEGEGENILVTVLDMIPTTVVE